MKVFSGTLAGAAVAAAAVVGVLVLEPAPLYSHTPITTNITFQKEISRIFQRRCIQCYADGNIAMSFATYADARLFFVQHALGRRDEARDALARARARVWQDPWLARILSCLAGELTPAELVASTIKTI